MKGLRDKEDATKGTKSTKSSGFIAKNYLIINKAPQRTENLFEDYTGFLFIKIKANSS